MPLAEGVLIIFALANQLLLMVLFLANAIFQRANFAIVKIVKKGVVDCETDELRLILGLLKKSQCQTGTHTVNMKFYVI